MKCYCYNDYYHNGYHFFIKGEYYNHIGAREMATQSGITVGFGTLRNWKLYFLEPVEDRDRKINAILDDKSNT